jgi:hypothetical protein
MATKSSNPAELSATECFAVEVNSAMSLRFYFIRITNLDFAFYIIIKMFSKLIIVCAASLSLASA